MISLSTLLLLGFAYFVATNPIVWLVGVAVGVMTLFVLSPTFRFIVTFSLVSIIYLAWIFTS
jgi:hypothetical protein